MGISIHFHSDPNNSAPPYTARATNHSAPNPFFTVGISTTNHDETILFFENETEAKQFVLALSAAVADFHNTSEVPAIAPEPARLAEEIEADPFAGSVPAMDYPDPFTPRPANPPCLAD